MSKKRKNSDSNVPHSKPARVLQPSFDTIKFIPRSTDIATPDENNSMLSDSKRTGIQLLFPWVEEWKDVVRIGMTCRGLYHFVLTANDLWKRIHKTVFGDSIQPEMIQPYQDTKNPKFSWRKFFIRSLKFRDNLIKGNCIRQSVEVKDAIFADYNMNLWKNSAIFEGFLRDGCVSLDSKTGKLMSNFSNLHASVFRDKAAVKIYSEQAFQFVDLSLPNDQGFIRKVQTPFSKSYSELDTVLTEKYFAVLCDENDPMVDVPVDSMRPVKVACYRVSDGALVREIELGANELSVTRFFRRTGWNSPHMSLYGDILCAYNRKNTFFIYHLTDPQKDKVLTTPQIAEQVIQVTEQPHLIATTTDRVAMILDLKEMEFHSIRMAHKIDLAATVCSSDYLGLYLSDLFGMAFVSLKRWAFQIKICATNAVMFGSVVFLTSTLSNGVDVWNLDTKQKLYSITLGEVRDIIFDGTRLYLLDESRSGFQGTALDFNYSDPEDYAKYVEEVEGDETTTNTEVQYLKKGELQNKEKGMLTLITSDEAVTSDAFDELGDEEE